MFDPYHKWLAIPKDQRPPTHYQLLGVAPGESDREVIEEAVIRQTSHLRAYQKGEYAADCARLLSEIAKARTTLLDPAKRKKYDEQIAPKKVETATPPPKPAPSPFDQLSSSSGNTKLISVKKTRKSSSGLWLGLLATVLLLVGATVVVVLVLQRGRESLLGAPKPGEDKPKTKTPDEKTKRPEKK